MNPLLFVQVQESDDGVPEVVAPTVGFWSDPPHEGAIVGPNSSVGSLRCLNKVYRLVLPEGVAGRVMDTGHDRVNPVGYGDTLFRLLPILGDQDHGEVGQAPGSARRSSDVPEGGEAVRAPTDGVFYRRPSPDAPPFVDVGSRVRTGQPIGLVEVMKTFNQIVYGGRGSPEEAEVVEVRCEDGTEVSAGQVLVVTRPTTR